MYSVSVRSENWKLNLLMNFRFSEVYGKEGKMRVSEVREVGWTLYNGEVWCGMSEFGVCHINMM